MTNNSLGTNSCGSWFWTVLTIWSPVTKIYGLVPVASCSERQGFVSYKEKGTLVCVKGLDHFVMEPCVFLS